MNNNNHSEDEGLNTSNEDNEFNRVVFFPFTAEGVAEYLRQHSRPEDAEETPPRKLRERLAWIKRQRGKRNGEISTSNQRTDTV